MIKTISYLGLGTMGSGMASNLLKAGYALTVWNRNAEKCEPFARKGARVADTPADAVRDVALAAGLVLAQKAGLDLNTVMEVVKVADFRSPLLVNNGENILERDFSTSFALKLMLKDAGLIEKFGESLESPIPALRVVEKSLESAVALGLGEENASAVIKALEKEAGVEVKARAGI